MSDLETRLLALTTGLAVALGVLATLVIKRRRREGT